MIKSENTNSIKEKANKNKLSFFAKIDVARTVITLAVYVVMVLLNKLQNKGNEVINNFLLALTLLYLLLYVIFVLIAYKPSKQVRKKTAKVYKNTKRVLIILNTVMTILSIITVWNGRESFVRILWALFTILSLFTQIVVEILISVFTKRVKALGSDIVTQIKEKTPFKKSLFHLKNDKLTDGSNDDNSSET